jgi:hypothetical protein
MPRMFSNSLKMSLLSGLFVFIAFYGFTIYCVIFCFVICNTQVIRWYSHSHTYFFQKHPFFSTKHLKTTFKIPHACASWQQLYMCILKLPKCPLSYFQYSQKNLKYCLKAIKSSLYKLKSIQKPSKAVKIYCTRLHFSIFKLRYRSFFNPNPTL